MSNTWNCLDLIAGSLSYENFMLEEELEAIMAEVDSEEEEEEV
jgi:hypothetical protein